ncbi:MAG: MFS transporter [Verrucomicrobia bacterium]|nr:MFS transporter [Verrucomicrobiota bacterium]
MKSPCPDVAAGTGVVPRYAWIIVVAATLVVFAALGLARFGYTMLLPSMQAGLSLDNRQAGGLATANLAGYLLLSVAGGALAARLGPRLVIAGGLLVAAAGMALTGLTGSFGGAMLWRTLTGVGSGASNVPVMGLVSSWFDRGRRGLATGIAVTGSSFALIALGSVVPRILAAGSSEGWRLCWFLFAGATCLVAAFAVLSLRNRNSTDDAAGQSRPVAAPILQWGTVYASSAVWCLGLIYVAFGFSYIIYITFFAKYLMVEGGYSQRAAGSLFMLMGWVSLLCGLLWGWVSDIIGRKWTLVIVFMIQAAAFGLFAMWPRPAGFTISAILFGLTAWSIPAIMAAACGDLLEPRLAPAGLGFVTLFFGIGQAIGPYAAGAIADATGRLSPAFVLAALVSLLGAVGSVLLRAEGKPASAGGLRDV